MSEDGKSIDKERVYYDGEEEAWVEESINLKTGMKVNLVFPSKKGDSFEKVKDEYTKKTSKMFQENYVKEKYIDFLNTLRIKHSQEMYNVFFNFTFRTFPTHLSEKDFENAKKEFLESILNILQEQE